MKRTCALCLGLACVSFMAGCGSLDTETTTGNSEQKAGAVPGEVNPDAPESQPVRTSPGVSF